ncbi:MAG: hypothetical protein ACOCXZ_01035 [Chloroflexota bacterium]
MGHNADTLDRMMNGPAAPTLQQALRFRPDDLTANRNGQLSEVQAYTLRLRRRRSIIIGIALLIVIAFVSTLFLYGGSQPDGSVILTLIGIGLTLCNAALIGIFGRFWMRLTADIRAGQVNAHTGPLERVIKPMNRRVLNYMIRVGEAEMFVSKETFDAFEHQQPYAIYRAPYTGVLLSAERLDSTGAGPDRTTDAPA